MTNEIKVRGSFTIDRSRLIRGALFSRGLRQEQERTQQGNPGLACSVGQWCQATGQWDRFDGTLSMDGKYKIIEKYGPIPDNVPGLNDSMIDREPEKAECLIRKAFAEAGWVCEFTVQYGKWFRRDTKPMPGDPDFVPGERKTPGNG